MYKTATLAVAVLLLAAGSGVGARQESQPDVSKTANPELVGELAKELQVTPQQAEGAAGALFDVAKKRMPSSDWTKVSDAVPGMDGLLKAAPAVATSGGSQSGVAGGVGGAVGTAGALGGAAAAFSQLGLKPDMVSKAVPVLTRYVTKTGGADVGSLLAGALK